MISLLLAFSFTIIQIKAICPILGTPSVCYTTTSNPCAAANPQNYWPSCTGYCNFIQCDAGTGSFDMPCGAGTVWDPSKSVYGACSNPQTYGGFEGPDPNHIATGNCDYNYAFVMDESGSVGEANYQASIDFVTDLVDNRIDITARLMALAFSSSHHQEYIHRFTDTQDPRTAILNALALERNDYDRGGTYTKAALQIVLDEFKAQSYTTNNIIILVTDGYPSDGPCLNNDLRDDLVDQGIRVVIVGVTTHFSATAVQCLVNGNLNDIIEIDNFDFAPAVTQLEIGQVVCTECGICGTANVCYDTDQNSPCNPLITASLYYYPSCTSRCHYIQCDDFGVAFDRPTAPGTVWDQSIPGINHPPAYYQGQYFIGPDLLTADEANDYCEYYGTTLASIHSQQELDTVTALCNAYSSNGECHIGMRLNPSNSEWEWTDCTDTDFGTASDPSCERTANYIIIVDESGSVGLTNFRKSYDFVIDELVSPVTGAINAESKIGAFSFGAVNDFVYYIGGVQNDNRASLLAALVAERADYDSGVTKTRQALQYAVDMFANAGITTDKVVILLTDGYPCCGPAAYPCTDALLLTALDDVEIYNILVDDFSKDDLTCLFEPGNTNVFEIGRTFDFSTVVQRIEDYQTSGECQMIDVATDGSSYFCATPCSHKKRPICNGAPTAPRPAPAAKTVIAHVLNKGHLGGHGKNVHLGGHGKNVYDMNGINNVKNVPVEPKSSYYGYIMVIGVIAFILMNNVFIGCWCLGTGRNKAHAKFDPLPVNDEI